MNKRIRNKWIELELGSKHTHWTLSYSVPSDDRDAWDWDNTKAKGERAIHRAWLTVGFWRIFMQLYLWRVKPFKGSYDSDSSKRYGITYFERSMHVHWGETKVYWMPWDWTIVRWDLLFPNGDVYYRNRYPGTTLASKRRTFSWYNVLDMNESPYPASPVEAQVAKYIDLEHHTKDGRKQVAKIRLAGEVREWRWRWLKWLPWPRQVSRTIDCMSDVELGSKAGSWKGGMLGWSVPWPEDESMEQAFHNWYNKWDGR